MYAWISIDKDDDLDQLISFIDRNAAYVVALLKGNLASTVKSILVEYPYNDKDYRSTYYEFYAKKGLRYEHFCYRLHFFGDGVTFKQDDFSFDWTGESLNGHYFGYMVVRPTSPTPVGRTVLSVKAKKGFNGSVIRAKHVVHLLGERLEVEGFPYMQQPTDISVCAHVACWSILRHNSQQHRKYEEFLLSDVTLSASDMRVGGLMPARGLTIDQAARIFSAAGLFPDTYSTDRFPDSAYRLLNAYVQSGFPVFAALDNMGPAANEGHAISVIGHGPVDRTALTVSLGVSKPAVQYEWDAINSFSVVDDNYMPYMMLDALNDTPYKFTKISAFVVPLPEKIYFPAEEVERRIEYLLQGGAIDTVTFDLSFMPNPVVRYFIATSAALRRYLSAGKSSIPKEIYLPLMELSLPQFVWIVQIADLQDWQQCRYTVLLVIDATASVYDQTPYLICHDRHKAFVYDRGDTEARLEFALSFEPSFGEFEKNTGHQ